MTDDERAGAIFSSIARAKGASVSSKGPEFVAARDIQRAVSPE